MARSICSVDGCGKIVKGNGYCEKHYDRFKKFGNPTHRCSKDKNDFIIIDGIVIMDLYDKNGIKVAETRFNERHLEEVIKYKWGCKIRDGKIEYVSSKIKGSSILFHRFLLNVPREYVIDHIDGDGLNNEDINLRITTQQRNSSNRKLPKNNPSGHMGVYRHKYNDRWISSITFDNNQIYLGSFLKKEDAIEARKQAEIKYFGEFSRQYGSEVGEE